VGRKTLPLCVSFDIINSEELRFFAREGHNATKHSITSLKEAYELCRKNQRTVICFWQKNAGRLGTANYKAVLEPRSSMSIPEIETVQFDNDKHPQMVESSKSTFIPTSFYMNKKKRGHEGVAMIEYLTNYDQLTHKFDQRSRPKGNVNRRKKS